MRFAAPACVPSHPADFAPACGRVSSTGPSATRYLHSDTFLAHEVMLIAGITTDTDAKLTDDITIGPWRARPAILREAQFEREELLVVRREISLPRVHESEPGASDGWISTGSPTGSDVLKGVNLCLTVATDAAHIVRAEWISPHPDVPLGSEQSGWTAPMDFHDSASHQLHGSEIDTLRELFRHYQRLSDLQQRHVDVAIRRLNRSRRANSIMDQAIELGITLEAAFLPEKRARGAFRLRLRAAKFMETEVGKRRLVFDRVDALQSLRNAAVHTGRFDRKEVKEARAVLPEGRALVKEALSRLIRDPVPDWRQIELGS